MPAGELGDTASEVLGGEPVGSGRHQLGALIGIRLSHRADEGGQPVEVVGRPLARVIAGGQAESDPIIIPCCMANRANCCSVASLSPFSPAELVKPAASLSRQRWSPYRGDVESRNALNGADAPAM